MSESPHAEWTKRRPINYVKPPKSWIRDCDRKGCPSRGILHAHAPRTHGEAAVLAHLADLTRELGSALAAAQAAFGGGA